MRLWMISGQEMKAPGLWPVRAELVWKETAVLQEGRAELIHGRTFLSESHELSAEQPGDAPAAHDTRACRTQKALLSYGAAAPRASQPAGEHGLLFRFLKMSLSSAPLSRPLVNGACPRVVGTQRGHPEALGTRPPGGRALPRGRAKCRGGGAPEVRQLLRPRCKVLQGGSRVPRPRGAGPGASRCPSAATGALVLAAPESVDWSSCASLLSPDSDDFYFNPN